MKKDPSSGPGGSRRCRLLPAALFCNDFSEGNAFRRDCFLEGNAFRRIFFLKIYFSIKAFFYEVIDYDENRCYIIYITNKIIQRQALSAGFIL